VAKTRDILKHVDVEVAKRSRKCHRSGDHSIAKDEGHLAVKDGSFLARRNYCLKCARPILDLAYSRLKGIEKQLYGDVELPRFRGR
jgi:hypothetical protein